ncbi:Maf family protein [Candidatus Accumulibacter sp. ACC003]|uniref:Maf family protein n=1 Tax=Candidatus Accumulibacter sp. ACC003 TaxID=2823334 RepID=UPI0025BD8EAF|nr:Maf family protein [Candidatus Accumulibacter sp. ACC003]
MSLANQQARVHLASRSPRRRDLLTQIGVGFDTIAFRSDARGDPELDETPLPGEDPSTYVERIARNKVDLGCRIVYWRRLLEQPVLAADTTIELAGELIGKPTDADDAKRILRRLSDRTHRVLTAMAIGFEGRIEVARSVSEVSFRELDDGEIDRYVASGEPMDKAGAYGIQGRAAMFIEHLAGSYTGVMGLPLCETAQLLKTFGYQP